MSNSLYNELLVKSEFSWQCPSCLFTVLPNNEVIDSIDLSSSADVSFNELSDYWKTPFRKSGHNSVCTKFTIPLLL